MAAQPEKPSMCFSWKDPFSAACRTLSSRSPKGAALKQAIRALRHRNFKLFFGGQIVSLVGTWMQRIAMGWLVYRLTNSPLHAGGRRVFRPDSNPSSGPGGRGIRRPVGSTQSADRYPNAGDGSGAGAFDARLNRCRSDLADIYFEHVSWSHQRLGHACPPGLHDRDG